MPVKSNLQIARAAYQPKLPVALLGPVKAVEGAKYGSGGEPEVGSKPASRARRRFRRVGQGSPEKCGGGRFQQAIHAHLPMDGRSYFTCDSRASAAFLLSAMLAFPPQPRHPRPALVRVLHRNGLYQQYASHLWPRSLLPVLQLECGTHLRTVYFAADQCTHQAVVGLWLLGHVLAGFRGGHLARCRSLIPASPRHLSLCGPGLCLIFAIIC